jgi:hypothetical protein
MKDVKIAHLKNSLKVSSVSKISSNPPILKIIGEKFNTATDILLDGIYARQWVAISDKEILLYIPVTFSNKTIGTIAVVSDELIPNVPNLTFFEVGSRVRKIEGIQKLVQQFTKILLQTPGSNKFQPVGGGLLSIIGKNTMSDDRTARTDIINGINRTKSYLISIQNNNKDLPLSEKLLDAKILNISSGTQPNVSLVVNIQITNRVGVSSSATVSV